MEQPKGYIKKGEENLVCKLERSLYGLKQSPRQWNKRFDTFMKKQGYRRSYYDHCLYYKGTEIHTAIYLLLYVDDILIISKEKAKVENLKNLLRAEFEMKDLGEAAKILGINIRRNRQKGKLTLIQEDYINKVLKKFSMEDAKITKQPITYQHQLSKAQCPIEPKDIDEMKDVPYYNVVGSIMYLMVCTRPGLAHVMSILSKYMANLGKEHWQAMKWTMRYLAGTTKVGLVYRRLSSKLLIEGYSDADYAGDKDSRRSTTTYFFTIGGSCVSWKVQLQLVVALSTTESEYIVVIEAIKEALWLHGHLEEITKTK